ncbi:DPY30 domain-containing protein 2 [Lynx canadensis]|uniref:DPY30 domain-containing protein 2 n=1 Tax=Lynx canadensis TaxID=61383 RepID=UPI0011B033F5|nr:DPY30 domain-containing protein 2 [Lynx canadensis]
MLRRKPAGLATSARLGTREGALPRGRDPGAGRGARGTRGSEWGLPGWHWEECQQRPSLCRLSCKAVSKEEQCKQTVRGALGKRAPSPLDSREKIRLKEEYDNSLKETEMTEMLKQEECQIQQKYDKCHQPLVSVASSTMKTVFIQENTKPVEKDGLRQESLPGTSNMVPGMPQ